MISSLFSYPFLSILIHGIKTVLLGKLFHCSLFITINHIHHHHHPNRTWLFNDSIDYSFKKSKCYSTLNSSLRAEFCLTERALESLTSWIYRADIHTHVDLIHSFIRAFMRLIGKVSGRGARLGYISVWGVSIGILFFFFWSNITFLRRNSSWTVVVGNVTWHVPDMHPNGLFTTIVWRMMTPKHCVTLFTPTNQPVLGVSL